MPSLWQGVHTLAQYPQSSVGDLSVCGSDTVCHSLQDPAYEQPMHLPKHAEKEINKQMFTTNIYNCTKKTDRSSKLSCYLSQDSQKTPFTRCALLNTKVNYLYIFFLKLKV